MAGSLKRGSPDMSEQLVLMRALRDMNLPKFVFDDVPLFLGLINDLFPGMDCPRVRYAQFNDTVEGDLAEHGFQVGAQMWTHALLTRAHTFCDLCRVLPCPGGLGVVEVRMQGKAEL